jgi:hypothetical protein
VPNISKRGGRIPLKTINTKLIGKTYRFIYGKITK